MYSYTYEVAVNAEGAHPSSGRAHCCCWRFKYSKSWWRHEMETFSALMAICAGNSPVPAQRPVTRSFDIFFDLRPNKRLSKRSWGLWFETQSRPLWCHRNVEWIDAALTCFGGASTVHDTTRDSILLLIKSQPCFREKKKANTSMDIYCIQFPNRPFWWIGSARQIGVPK